jgi:hypothetical protein
MIQFNLLPDVKLQYIKVARMKRTVIMICTLITGIAMGVFLLLFLVVAVVQKQYLNNLNHDIADSSKKLQSIENLDKILTVQNQLNGLPGLHDKKPVVTRLADYLERLTPANASIASLIIDFDQKTIVITGSADSLKTVNMFVDTLKFTDFEAGDTKGRAFSGVVLSSFGRDDKGASYNIQAKFDQTIFDSAVDVKLIVPAIITNRSETEKPNEALFQPLSNSEEQQ